MQAHKWLKTLTFFALLGLGAAQTPDSPRRFLVKIGEDIGAQKSRVGDRVTAAVISPERFLGAKMSGRIDRASPGALRFTFDSLTHRGKTYRIASTIVGSVNSLGHKSVDEQERPVRVAAGVLTSPAAAFTINEGAEFELDIALREK